MIKNFLNNFTLLTFLVIGHANAFTNKNPTSVVNGVNDERHIVYAFKNAHIIESHNEIENGTMLIQDNLILNIGKDISIPNNAIVFDLNGAFVYPGFILLDSNYGLSKIPDRAPFTFFGKETMDSTIKGPTNTNEAIKASYKAILDFHHDDEQSKKLRANGFTTVLSSKHDGIMRGNSVLVSLNDTPEQQSIVKDAVSFHLSFDKGSSKQLYPISLMGGVALIRQTWLDAQWYGNGKTGFTDLDLQAINDSQSLLQIFESKNWQQSILANKIAKEFNKKIIIRTTGDEYKHINAIKKLNASLIVPLAHIKAPDVSDKLDAWSVPLEKMMEWEQAPYNLYYLHKNNILFAIAPSLKDGQKSFLKDLREAVKKGLPKSTALAALTDVPAKLLRNAQLGNLKRGSFANFIISEKDLFTEKSKIAESWVSGKRFVLNKISQINPGLYQLSLNDKSLQLDLTYTKGKFTLKNKDKEDKTSYKISIEDDFAQLTIKTDDKSSQFLGIVSQDGIHNIKGQSPEWFLNRISDSEKEDKKDKEKDNKNEIPKIPQPFSAYGLFQPEKANTFLIQNTTVWTNERNGILKGTDVFIKNGKIQAIGKKLPVKADKTIDGSSMHLTAGIIDEHSHIALLSVNDIATNSSMVRMEDALDSDSINIYRNLSGGVTAAQLLHGSANPLGGQSAIIKMRWGAVSDELLIKNADKFIKFALGENVKRSASKDSIRFPLTRMGVEQVYRDAFSQAKLYNNQVKNQYKTVRSFEKVQPSVRRDLMLETTAEILNGQRFITCHSYVQSEINMLMKVADNFGFKVNTFTHILEGYKVADKMKAHGVGASTFSDWWSYKWEVNYAIPYNASILTKAGVTTAINSDDGEMARRLNQEAAKSIKYGGLSQEEALKLVTLNPAKLLHLDKRMGSIKVGKDADLVLWSGNPLSIYAKADKTFVDGKLLFDRHRQGGIEKIIADERKRLITKINQSDEPKTPMAKMPEKKMQCDSITGYEYLLGAGK